MADPSSSTSDPDAAELEAVRAKLNSTEQELNNYKLRLADFENARKRLLRDSEVEKKYASESLTRDLLAALDNLDRALSAAKAAGDAGPLVAGVSATASQFLDILRRYGVTKIECPPGTEFDPNLHQAVMEQPNPDFQPGHVVQVLQQGFLLHDRVLRPASVIVAASAS
ncbi:MAG TPA: nucleotide exchange factor GrpE [Gemmata sp.]|jgi:molecular chaperone GrpE|nr:nucleotide exchange factor GrpE [Gemmata sp.]